MVVLMEALRGKRISLQISLLRGSVVSRCRGRKSNTHYA